MSINDSRIDMNNEAYTNISNAFPKKVVAEYQNPNVRAGLRFVRAKLTVWRVISSARYF
jgi:hypothetical protein